MSTIDDYHPRTWWPVAVWGVAAYLFHDVGDEIGLYSQFGWFQNLTHGFSASALAALLLVAGLALGLRGPRLIAFVVAFAAAGAVGWEALEFLGLLDRFGMPLHFHSFQDAAVDMASNAVGVSLTLGLFHVATRRGWRWPFGIG